MTISVVVPLSIVVMTAAVPTLTSSTGSGTSGMYSVVYHKVSKFSDPTNKFW